jgi:hypothetical protein
MKCKHNDGSNYDRTGQWVIAKYQDQAWVTGLVQSSRVKLGGIIQHTVLSDSPTFLGEELRMSGSVFLVEENHLSESQEACHA